MEQNLALDKMVSIAGTLLMLDDTTPHVAVPIQAIREVMEEFYAEEDYTKPRLVP